MVQLAEWLLRQPTHVRSVYTRQSLKSSQPLTKKFNCNLDFRNSWEPALRQKIC
jgi:hypothetical protein